MIDTYMDRCDAATSKWQCDRHNNVKQTYEDPRYWCGRLFNTVIDRQVAEAGRRLSNALATGWLDHRHEMEAGIKAGDDASMFRLTGRHK